MSPSADDPTPPTRPAHRRLAEVVRREGLQRALGKVAAKAAKAVVSPAETALASAALKIRSQRIVGIDESLDFVYGFSIGKTGIAPEQIRSEISAFLRFAESVSPKIVLEIGTGYGGCLFLLSRIATDDATLISIDFPTTGYSGRYQFGKGYPLTRILMLRAVPKSRQHLELIRGDSHQQSTVEFATRSLANRFIDVALIDGDHSYEGVARDFEMYGALVRPGGLIAFHDIVPGDEDKVGGVPRFWQSIRSKYKVHEFVESWAQGGWGLGVIEVPPTGIVRGRADEHGIPG